MANSTVTDALTKLFLALGGDPTKLSDDHNLTDYLDDVADALVDVVKAELPTVTSDDFGKSLVVSESGYWTKGNVLPTVSSSDNGKVLTVTSGYWNKKDAPVGLPDVSTSNKGNSLFVNSNGVWDKTMGVNLGTVTINTTSGAIVLELETFNRIELVSQAKGVRSSGNYLTVTIDGTSHVFTNISSGGHGGAYFVGYYYDLSSSKHYKATVFISLNTDIVSDAYKIEEVSFS